jgi:hypothetical protein
MEQKLVELKKGQSLALKVAAKTKHARAIELAKKWDLQGTGSIVKTDFRTSVRSLGIKAEDDDIDALFARMDEDASGSMDLSELRAALQRLQDEASVAAEATAKATALASRLRGNADFSQRACKLMRASEEAEEELRRLRSSQPLHFRLGDAIEGGSDQLAAKWSRGGSKGAGKEGGCNKLQFRKELRELGAPRPGSNQRRRS